MLLRRSLILAPGLATAAAAPAKREAVRGLDLVPLAVKDLECSKVDFEALGLALKLGRVHHNGLRIAHVTFPDGTEIEPIIVFAVTPKGFALGVIPRSFICTASSRSWWSRA